MLIPTVGHVCKFSIYLSTSSAETRVRTLSLRSFESAYEHDIELAFRELELWRRVPDADDFPSSIPFSIPLPPDTPQSIQTPRSMLAHTLSTTLQPADAHSIPISKSLIVYTRRFTSHSNIIPVSPETHSMEFPTHVNVQLPRNTFTSGEPILLYVTVPPPSRETVVNRGLRLRNIRTELIRVIKVKREHLEDDEYETDSDLDLDDSDPHQRGSSFLASTDHGDASHPSSSKMPLSPLFLGSSYRTIIARSGASCRFHSTRSIRLRFVLHQNSSISPSDSRTNLERMESDIDTALITQSTLLHTVSFLVKVHISFVDTSNQTERVSTMVVPVTILPPHATLPEVSPALDDAYQKKHDRPPARTVRAEEADPSIPHYSEGEAGPSMLSHGAPPPFEERDAPPPFSPSGLEASSSRLPTFQESESEIILPDNSHYMDQLPVQVSIPGEGVIFGFTSEQQFDGHSEDMQRSSTPPPTLEMASRDTDLTPLTDQPTHVTIETINLVLDQHDDGLRSQEHLPPPPPPPAMDDPSDPPPSIDSDFRSPPGTLAQQSSPPSADDEPLPYIEVPLPVNVTPAPPATEAAQSAAPPPYLNPDGHRVGGSDAVIGPPPYVD